MKTLVRLDVTAKSPERTAEAIGTGTAASRKQREIGKAVPLDPPVVVGGFFVPALPRASA